MAAWIQNPAELIKNIGLAWLTVAIVCQHVSLGTLVIIMSNAMDNKNKENARDKRITAEADAATTSSAHPKNGNRLELPKDIPVEALKICYEEGSVEMKLSAKTLMLRAFISDKHCLQLMQRDLAAKDIDTRWKAFNLVLGIQSFMIPDNSSDLSLHKAFYKAIGGEVIFQKMVDGLFWDVIDVEHPDSENRFLIEVYQRDVLNFFSAMMPTIIAHNCRPQEGYLSQDDTAALMFWNHGLGDFMVQQDAFTRRNPEWTPIFDLISDDCESDNITSWDSVRGLVQSLLRLLTKQNNLEKLQEREEEYTNWAIDNPFYQLFKPLHL